ncbi:MAG: hypothetical protein HY961_17510 [Ignavibacteriae bacterium]|nr:hypothetical protein [Ignavibacteriota bacterium]
MKQHFFFVVMMIVVSVGFAQRPEDLLQQIPNPPQDVAEAVVRCPVEIDTLLRPMLNRLSSLADKDTNDREEIANLHRSLHLKFLEKLRRELENGIQDAGEAIDRAIKECPTVADSQGRQVYDPHCVELAEQRGHERRVAVVEDYLSRVHEVWSDYKSATAKQLTSLKKGKWQLVLRFAVDAASIGEIAGQFAR